MTNYSIKQAFERTYNSNKKISNGRGSNPKFCKSNGNSQKLFWLKQLLLIFSLLRVANGDFMFK